jgi:hypothetical protein
MSLQIFGHFGCLLIDIFSEINPIFKINITPQELYSLHEYENGFPTIPRDIDGLLKDIVSSCLSFSYTKRMKMDALISNMNIYLESCKKRMSIDNISYNKGNDKNKELQGLRNSNDPKIKEYYQFVKDKEVELNYGTKLITEELSQTLTKDKNSLSDIYNSSFGSLNERLNYLNNEINSYCKTNMKLSTLLKDKIIERIMKIQEVIAHAGSEVFESKIILDELSVNVLTIANLKNYNSFNFMLDQVEKSIGILDLHSLRYKNNKPYDKLLAYLNEVKDLMSTYKIFSFNESIMLDHFITGLEKSKEELGKNSELKKLSKSLSIEKEVSKLVVMRKEKKAFKDSQWLITASSNSNIFAIFDLENKQFYHYNIDSEGVNILEFDEFVNKNNSSALKYQYINKNYKNKFLPKSSSIFNYEDKKLYFTGGMLSKNEFELNCFYSMEIEILDELIPKKLQSDCDKNMINLKFKSMPNMLFSHYCHSSIIYDNYLVVIGGSNTRTAEFFSFKNQQWYELPELPIFTPNSSICLHDNKIFCFGISSEVNYYSKNEYVYSLSLVNFKRGFIDKFLGNSFQKWEEVEYKMFDGGSLFKGMISVSKSEDSILLFGGFNTDTSRYDIYEMEFKSKIDKNNSNVNKNKDEKEKEKGKIKGVNNANTGDDKKTKTEIEDDNLDDYIIINDGSHKLKVEKKTNKGKNNTSSSKIKENGTSQSFFESLEDEKSKVNITNKDYNGQNMENINKDDNGGIEDEIDDTLIKINKHLTELPVGTFFNSNSFYRTDDTVILVCGNFNAFEFNFKTNNIYYYT